MSQAHCNGLLRNYQKGNNGSTIGLRPIVDLQRAMFGDCSMLLASLILSLRESKTPDLSLISQIGVYAVVLLQTVNMSL